MQEELKENGNPQAVFEYDKPGAFGVIVKDALFDAEFNNNIREESSEKMSEKMSEKILKILGENNAISAKEIADLIEKSSRTIEREILKLKIQGKLKRIGPDKGGHWEVIDGK